MKKFVFTSFVAVLYLSHTLAQGGGLTAYFSYCTFTQPGNAPFIETYVSVVGNSVRFVPNEKQKLQSKIEVQWVLKKADKIVYFDKYFLLSPEMANDSSPKPNFLDLKRIAVPKDSAGATNGDYSLELTIADKNSANSKNTINQKILVDYVADRPQFSDIELLESYAKSESPTDRMSKSGYTLEPYISNFFPKEINAIKFYVELYNAKKIVADEDFVVRYEVVNEGNKQIFGDVVGYRKVKGGDANGVNVILAELPLDQVPSGNYSVVLEARNKKNELFAYQSVYFQRSKPLAIKETADDFSLIDINNTFISQISNKDTLKDYIACLYPISDRLERQIEDNQIAMGRIESMKQYIYYFWSKRDAANPERKWLDYKGEVDKVNASFSVYNRKGYDTDRGRVYLQYGPPNTIDVADREPNTYPYEVWHYYKLGDQTNKKFVFYAKDGASNNYLLLHSDATGEIYTYDWQLRLHERSSQFGTDIDADQAPPAYGDQSLDRFNHPK